MFCRHYQKSLRKWWLDRRSIICLSTIPYHAISHLTNTITPLRWPYSGFWLIVAYLGCWYTWAPFEDNCSQTVWPNIGPMWFSSGLPTSWQLQIVNEWCCSVWPHLTVLIIIYFCFCSIYRRTLVQQEPSLDASSKHQQLFELILKIQEKLINNCCYWSYYFALREHLAVHLGGNYQTSLECTRKKIKNPALVCHYFNLINTTVNCRQLLWFGCCVSSFA